jgi:hypothetical protein
MRPTSTHRQVLSTSKGDNATLPPTAHLRPPPPPCQNQTLWCHHSYPHDTLLVCDAVRVLGKLRPVCMMLGLPQLCIAAQLFKPSHNPVAPCTTRTTTSACGGFCDPCQYLHLSWDLLNLTTCSHMTPASPIACQPDAPTRRKSTALMVHLKKLLMRLTVLMCIRRCVHSHPEPKREEVKAPGHWTHDTGV